MATSLPIGEKVCVTQLKIENDHVSDDFTKYCESCRKRCIHLKSLPCMPWKTWCSVYDKQVNEPYEWYSRYRRIPVPGRKFLRCIGEYPVMMAGIAHRLPECEFQELEDVMMNWRYDEI